MRLLRLWLAQRRLARSRWHRDEADRLLTLVEQYVDRYVAPRGDT